MKVILGSLIFILLVASNPRPAHAIVILPAVLLIPIIKIVAIVIGSLSVPAISISALWSKLFGKSLPITIAWTVAVLILIGILLGIFLKIRLPDRPII